jgi:putative hydrolase of the HAD superfamily
MLKAILFDLDDTLIDWSGFTLAWETLESRHLRNVFDFLKLQSEFQHYNDEYLRRARDAWAEARNTLRAPHLGRLLVDAAVAVGASVDSIDMAACLDAYGWRAVEDTLLFPEVLEMLQAFTDHGLKLGIVTNSFHPITVRDLEIAGHGLSDFFPDCRVTAADVGYLKPHPEIFEYALNKLGVSADEAVFVGDNAVADIAGAQGAGMYAIQRRIRGRIPATSGLVIPDAVIYSLTELPEVLEKLFPNEVESTPSEEQAG